MSALPRIAITLGDPGGIGPEITARALALPEVAESCRPIVFGPRSTWERACSLVGASPDVTLVSVDDRPADAFPYAADDAIAGAAQLASLEQAANALASGEADGLCTAPISKHAVGLHVPGFVGHTEWLQQRFEVPRVVMLMAGEQLRVALATTHVALKEVPELLDPAELAATIELTASELKRLFRIEAPRVAVCALNPHAGEQGRFGDEEGRLVLPAIERVRAAGVDVHGPFAADGFFARAIGGVWDAIVALYHDQGLIPFKLVEGLAGVNVTLGLPRPRTSPDHGVAHDVAGRGVADPASMVAALKLCVRLAG